MKSLKIWFWCVGIFYLLLTCLNIGILFLQPESLSTHLPEKYNLIPEAVNIFADAWLVFIFELGVLGAFCLVAARNPVKNVIMAWVIIFAEAFRGIAADLIWILRGYSAADYAVFIVIHAIIIVTGYIFIRKAVTVALAPELSAKTN